MSTNSIRERLNKQKCVERKLNPIQTRLFETLGRLGGGAQSSPPLHILYPSSLDNEIW